MVVNSYSNSQKSFVSFIRNPFTEENSLFAFKDSNISEVTFDSIEKTKPLFLIYKRRSQF